MIVAGFTSADALVDALARLRRAGVLAETRTHVALPEDAASGRSPWPRYALMAGVLGAAAGFALQCFATMSSYPLLIGGRPDFFWTSYLVYAFECGVLATTLTCFLGFLVACRMPALYEPEDEIDALVAATRDGWFLLLRHPDERARDLVRALRPAALQELRK